MLCSRHAADTVSNASMKAGFVISPGMPMLWLRAAGRDAHPAPRGAHCVGRLEAGEHEALGAKVQGPPDAQPRGFLDAHECRRRGGLQGVDPCQQVGLGQRAVLEVEDDPVEPGAAHQLRRGR